MFKTLAQEAPEVLAGLSELERADCVRLMAGNLGQQEAEQLLPSKL